MFWYSNLIYLVSIIVGIICIAIAASWSQRAAKFSCNTFVMVSPQSSIVVSGSLLGGFSYSSICWFLYLHCFFWMLPIVLLVIFAVAARFPVEGDATGLTETTSRPIEGPTWNTNRDARQLRLISMKRNFAFLVDGLPLILAYVAGVSSVRIVGIQINGDRRRHEASLR